MLGRMNDSFYVEGVFSNCINDFSGYFALWIFCCLHNSEPESKYLPRAFKSTFCFNHIWLQDVRL